MRFPYCYLSRDHGESVWLSKLTMIWFLWPNILFFKSIQIILFPSKWKRQCILHYHYSLHCDILGACDQDTLGRTSLENAPPSAECAITVQCGGTRRGTSLSVLWHNKEFLGFDFQKFVIGWVVLSPPPNSYVEVLPASTSFVYIWRQSLKR